MEKSMFFWTHDFPEDGCNRGINNTNLQSRSKSNAQEADMVVALSLLLLKRGNLIMTSEVQKYTCHQLLSITH